MDVRNYISKLPIRDSKKLSLYNLIMKPYWACKSMTDEFENYGQFLNSFLHQNTYYGHEYWLRKFSSYRSPIYALIEHGISLGDDVSLIGWKAEWGVGSALTFGKYRAMMLQKIFPNHLIVSIGPRIHYADTDQSYYNEILSKIDKTSKTMVLYPSHSVEREAYDYDLDSFYNSAISFARDYDIKNILLSLHPSDLFHGFAERYNALDKNIIVVTGGMESKRFLPRLKAILSIADITFSNKFGTHVGYSLYMGKPHIINSTSDTFSASNYSKLYNKKENQIMIEHETKFNKMFNGSNPWVISKEQKEFADYYFGFSSVKTPQEMCDILQKCKNNYQENYK